VTPPVKSLLALATGAVLLSPGTSRADTLSRGSVSLEGRGFQPDDFEETEDYGVALTTQLEINTRPTRAIGLVVRGLARLDALDRNRNVGAVEDAYAAYGVGPLTLRVGAQVLTWTSTEAFHPADIMNSRNFDSDLESPEKLGEPMVELRLRLFSGYISAYYMPMRLPSRLPGNTSRLSPFGPNPAGLELGDSLWMERDGKTSESLFAHQGALHVAQTIGKADIGLHVVDHNDRAKPTFTLIGGEGVVRPTYHTVTQVGLTYTQVFGNLIAKLEGAQRWYREPDEEDEMAEDVDAQEDHAQVAAGLEYGWTTDPGHSASVLLEGGYLILDDREYAKQLDVLQGDVLVAYRHGFNDSRGQELRIGLLADFERPSEYVASVRWSQSITDVWSVVAIVRSARLLGKDVHQGQMTLLRNF
jgi:hypothetical protein